MPLDGPARPPMPSRSCDWLALTLQARAADTGLTPPIIGQLAAWLGEPNLADRPDTDRGWMKGVGRHGYTASLTQRATGARIEWAGTQAQGVHLTLPGVACQARAAATGAADWPVALLAHLAHRAPTVTRLDIALDGQEISPSTWIIMQHTGRLLTRLKRGPRSISERGRGLGTVYLGSRTGLAYVRAYDRAEVLAGASQTEYAAVVSP